MDEPIIRDIYKNPAFKSKYWLSTQIFQEKTPLLKQNIDEFLSFYTPYSNAYDNFYDYVHECRTKDFPQVVGLPEVEHWVAVQRLKHNYYIFDSSGAPEEAYHLKGLSNLPPNVHTATAGVIRQSPFSAACGEWATLVCFSYFFYNDCLYMWDSLGHRQFNYKPLTMLAWETAYKAAEADFFLHDNDINISNYFLYLMQNIPSGHINKDILD